MSDEMRHCEVEILLHLTNCCRLLRYVRWNETLWGGDIVTLDKLLSTTEICQMKWDIVRWRYCYTGQIVVDYWDMSDEMRHCEVEILLHWTNCCRLLRYVRWNETLWGGDIVTLDKLLSTTEICQMKWDIVRWRYCYTGQIVVDYWDMSDEMRHCEVEILLHWTNCCQLLRYVRWNETLWGGDIVTLDKLLSTTEICQMKWDIVRWRYCYTGQIVVDYWDMSDEMRHCEVEILLHWTNCCRLLRYVRWNETLWGGDIVTLDKLLSTTEICQMKWDIVRWRYCYTGQIVVDYWDMSDEMRHCEVEILLHWTNCCRLLRYVRWNETLWGGDIVTLDKLLSTTEICYRWNETLWGGDIVTLDKLLSTTEICQMKWDIVRWRYCYTGQIVVDYWDMSDEMRHCEVEILLHWTNCCRLLRYVRWNETLWGGDIVTLDKLLSTTEICQMKWDIVRWRYCYTGQIVVDYWDMSDEMRHCEVEILLHWTNCCRLLRYVRWNETLWGGDIVTLDKLLSTTEICQMKWDIVRWRYCYTGQIVVNYWDMSDEMRHCEVEILLHWTNCCRLLRYVRWNETLWGGDIVTLDKLLSTTEICQMKWDIVRWDVNYWWNETLWGGDIVTLDKLLSTTEICQMKWDIVRWRYCYTGQIVVTGLLRYVRWNETLWGGDIVTLDKLLSTTEICQMKWDIVRWRYCYTGQIVVDYWDMSDEMRHCEVEILLHWRWILLHWQIVVDYWDMSDEMRHCEVEILLHWTNCCRLLRYVRWNETLWGGDIVTLDKLLLTTEICQMKWDIVRWRYCYTGQIVVDYWDMSDEMRHCEVEILLHWTNCCRLLRYVRWNETLWGGDIVTLDKLLSTTEICQMKWDIVRWRYCYTGQIVVDYWDMSDEMRHCEVEILLHWTNCCRLLRYVRWNETLWGGDIVTLDKLLSTTEICQMKWDIVRWRYCYTGQIVVNYWDMSDEMRHCEVEILLHWTNCCQLLRYVRWNETLWGGDIVTLDKLLSTTEICQMKWDIVRWRYCYTGQIVVDYWDMSDEMRHCEVEILLHWTNCCRLLRYVRWNETLWGGDIVTLDKLLSTTEICQMKWDIVRWRYCYTGQIVVDYWDMSDEMRHCEVEILLHWTNCCRLLRYVRWNETLWGGDIVTLDKLLSTTEICQMKWDIVRWRYCYTGQIVVDYWDMSDEMRHCEVEILLHWTNCCRLLRYVRWNETLWDWTNGDIDEIHWTNCCQLLRYVRWNETLWGGDIVTLDKLLSTTEICQMKWDIVRWRYCYTGQIVVDYWDMSDEMRHCEVEILLHWTNCCRLLRYVRWNETLWDGDIVTLDKLLSTTDYWDMSDEMRHCEVEILLHWTNCCQLLRYVRWNETLWGGDIVTLDKLLSTEICQMKWDIVRWRYCYTGQIVVDYWNETLWGGDIVTLDKLLSTTEICQMKWDIVRWRYCYTGQIVVNYWDMSDEMRHCEVEILLHWTNCCQLLRYVRWNETLWGGDIVTLDKLLSTTEICQMKWDIVRWRYCYTGQIVVNYWDMSDEMRHCEVEILLHWTNCCQLLRYVRWNETLWGGDIVTLDKLLSTTEICQMKWDIVRWRYCYTGQIVVNYWDMSDEMRHCEVEILLHWTNCCRLLRYVRWNETLWGGDIVTLDKLLSTTEICQMKWDIVRWRYCYTGQIVVDYWDMSDEMRHCEVEILLHWTNCCQLLRYVRWNETLWGGDIVTLDKLLSTTEICQMKWDIVRWRYCYTGQIVVDYWDMSDEMRHCEVEILLHWTNCCRLLRYVRWNETLWGGDIVTLDKLLSDEMRHCEVEILLHWTNCCRLLRYVRWNETLWGGDIVTLDKLLSTTEICQMKWDIVRWRYCWTLDKLLDIDYWDMSDDHCEVEILLHWTNCCRLLRYVRWNETLWGGCQTNCCRLLRYVRWNETLWGGDIVTLDKLLSTTDTGQIVGDIVTLDKLLSTTEICQTEICQMKWDIVRWRYCYTGQIVVDYWDMSDEMRHCEVEILLHWTNCCRLLRYVRWNETLWGGDIVTLDKLLSTTEICQMKWDIVRWRYCYTGQIVVDTEICQMKWDIVRWRYCYTGQIVVNYWDMSDEMRHCEMEILLHWTNCCRWRYCYTGQILLRYGRWNETLWGGDIVTLDKLLSLRYVRWNETLWGGDIVTLDYWDVRWNETLWGGDIVTLDKLLSTTEICQMKWDIVRWRYCYTGQIVVDYWDMSDEMRHCEVEILLHWTNCCRLLRYVRWNETLWGGDIVTLDKLLSTTEICQMKWDIVRWRYCYTGQIVVNYWDMSDEMRHCEVEILLHWTNCCQLLRYVRWNETLWGGDIVTLDKLLSTTEICQMKWDIVRWRYCYTGQIVVDYWDMSDEMRHCEVEILLHWTNCCWLLRYVRWNETLWGGDIVTLDKLLSTTEICQMKWDIVRWRYCYTGQIVVNYWDMSDEMRHCEVEILLHWTNCCQLLRYVRWNETLWGGDIVTLDKLLSTTEICEMRHCEVEILLHWTNCCRLLRYGWNETLWGGDIVTLDKLLSTTEICQMKWDIVRWRYCYTGQIVVDYWDMSDEMRHCEVEILLHWTNCCRLLRYVRWNETLWEMEILLHWTNCCRLLRYVRWNETLWGGDIVTLDKLLSTTEICQMKWDIVRWRYCYTGQIVVIDTGLRYVRWNETLWDGDIVTLDKLLYVRHCDWDMSDEMRHCEVEILLHWTNCCRLLRYVRWNETLWGGDIVTLDKLLSTTEICQMKWDIVRWRYCYTGQIVVDYWDMSDEMRHCEVEILLHWTNCCRLLRYVRWNETLWGGDIVTLDKLLSTTEICQMKWDIVRWRYCYTGQIVVNYWDMSDEMRHCEVEILLHWTNCCRLLRYVRWNETLWGGDIVTLDKLLSTTDYWDMSDEMRHCEVEILLHWTNCCRLLRYVRWNETLWGGDIVTLDKLLSTTEICQMKWDIVRWRYCYTGQIVVDYWDMSDEMRHCEVEILLHWTNCCQLLRYVRWNETLWGGDIVTLDKLLSTTEICQMKWDIVRWRYCYTGQIVVDYWDMSDEMRHCEVEILLHWTNCCRLLRYVRWNETLWDGDIVTLDKLLSTTEICQMKWDIVRWRYCYTGQIVVDYWDMIRWNETLWGGDIVTLDKLLLTTEICQMKWDIVRWRYCYTGQIVVDHWDMSDEMRHCEVEILLHWTNCCRLLRYVRWN
jgi:hypothetical protein